MRCKCGSYAINPYKHGRDGFSDLDLCDVCYWRKRAEGVKMITYKNMKFCDEQTCVGCEKLLTSNIVNTAAKNYLPLAIFAHRPNCYRQKQSHRVVAENADGKIDRHV